MAVFVYSPYRMTICCLEDLIFELNSKDFSFEFDLRVVSSYTDKSRLMRSLKLRSKRVVAVFVYSPYRMTICCLEDLIFELNSKDFSFEFDLRVVSSYTDKSRLMRSLKLRSKRVVAVFVYSPYRMTICCLEDLIFELNSKDFSFEFDLRVVSSYTDKSRLMRSLKLRSKRVVAVFVYSPYRMTICCLEDLIFELNSKDFSFEFDLRVVSSYTDKSRLMRSLKLRSKRVVAVFVYSPSPSPSELPSSWISLLVRMQMCVMPPVETRN